MQFASALGACLRPADLGESGAAVETGAEMNTASPLAMNARVSFATDAAGNLSAGQINGSIPHSNLINTFPPAIAAMCNASVIPHPALRLHARVFSTLVAAVIPPTQATFRSNLAR